MNSNKFAIQPQATFHLYLGDPFQLPDIGMCLSETNREGAGIIETIMCVWTANYKHFMHLWSALIKQHFPKGVHIQIVVIYFGCMRY